MDGSGWTGGAVTARATCVLAPNPGPLTLEGTNTWVLAEPGARSAVVVDPGELDPVHHGAVLAELAGRGLVCALVLVTHHHADHAGGLDAFRAAAGGPAVLRFPAALDGQDLDVDDLALRVLRTPGHTADSLCVQVPGDRAVLTGDTLLGRGSTVVGHPDGDVGAYLASLERLLALPEPAVLLPGHGPARTDARAALRTQLEHRRDRLGQVRAAAAAGAGTLAQVVAAVHPGLDERLVPAAERSVRAQLLHLGVDLPG
ncbi:MBL fold metallo-hydrolase [Kineococcus rubinsiae]|uniref:MBL fold metallo-hydrolase n=1 Tax=Kineococcus rubinsiae TaxID=2609562 RepID=UPI0027E577E2|nr:MBL fold metallo-hydrolase [Kineococcus rubinsiae]